MRKGREPTRFINSIMHEHSCNILYLIYHQIHVPVGISFTCLASSCNVGDLHNTRVILYRGSSIRYRENCSLKGRSYVSFGVTISMGNKTR